MVTRIGFDHYTIAHRGFSATETLEFACQHGLEGVQFLDPTEIDRSLHPDTLADFRRRADAMGLYLELGLPSPNPVRQSRLEGRSIEPTELTDNLARQVEAVARLGCRHARVYVGDRHDRFRSEFPWTDQLDATLDVLERLTPTLRDHRVKIAIETHADLTVDELLGLLDPLDPAVAGVTIDTGNLVMRLDDPLVAVERLAARVVSSHVKDCVLSFTPRGLLWQARPVGSGVLPMPDLLAPLLHANPELNLSIELHPRTYDLPIHDPSWLAYFPRLQPDALASVVRLAELSEERFATGYLERPEVVESIPWADRDLEWLALSLGYLRRVVPALARVDATSPIRAIPG